MSYQIFVYDQTTIIHIHIHLELVGVGLGGVEQVPGLQRELVRLPVKGPTVVKLY